MTSFFIHRKKGYTIVDNNFIHDKKLSYAAKGVLLFLHFKDDKWVFNEDEILQHTNDNKEILQQAINELKEQGYIKG